jgi:hypothetical protein
MSLVREVRVLVGDSAYGSSLRAWSGIRPKASISFYLCWEELLSIELMTSELFSHSHHIGCEALKWKETM